MCNDGNSTSIHPAMFLGSATMQYYIYIARWKLYSAYSAQKRDGKLRAQVEMGQCAVLAQGIIQPKMHRCRQNLNMQQLVACK
jgi:hypothetical protein